MKSIPGFEGFYEADTLGNIYSVPRVVTQKNGKPYKTQRRLMSLKTTKSGYLMAHLRANGESKTPLAHRLILSTFVSEPQTPNNLVNHKNGDKQDNRIENLEWCNKSENASHAYSVLHSRRGGLGRIDSLNALSKPVIATRINDGAKLEFKSMMDAKRSGFNVSCISECVNGTQKTHKSMLWHLA